MVDWDYWVDHLSVIVKTTLGGAFRVSKREGVAFGRKVADAGRAAIGGLSGPVASHVSAFADGVGHFVYGYYTTRYELTKAQVRSARYVASRVASVLRDIHADTDWAAVADEVASEVTSVARHIADNAGRAARRIQLDLKRWDEGDDDFQQLSGYVAAMVSGDWSGVELDDYLGYLEQQVRSIYSDEDLVQETMRVLSVVPAEVAWEKLDGARELLQEIDLIYEEDTFSVNHAMRRLHGLTGVSAEYELNLMRMYAADTGLARAYVMSLIPEDKKAALKPVVDGFEGENVEEMMYHMQRFVKSGTTPNVLGVFGPHVWTKWAKDTKPRQPTTNTVPRVDTQPFSRRRYFHLPPDICISGEKDGGAPQGMDANVQPPAPNDEFVEDYSDSAVPDTDPPPDYNTWGGAAVNFVGYVAGAVALAGLKLHDLNNAIANNGVDFGIGFNNPNMT